MLAFGTTGLQSTKRWIRRAQVQLQTSSWPLSRFFSSPCYEVDLMHKYDTNPEQHILIFLSECKLGGHPTPGSFAFVSLLIDIFRVAKLVQLEYYSYENLCNPVSNYVALLDEFIVWRKKEVRTVNMWLIFSSMTCNCRP